MCFQKYVVSVEFRCLPWTAVKKCIVLKCLLSRSLDITGVCEFMLNTELCKKQTNNKFLHFNQRNFSPLTVVSSILLTRKRFLYLKFSIIHINKDFIT